MLSPFIVASLQRTRDDKTESITRATEHMVATSTAAPPINSIHKSTPSDIRESTPEHRRASTVDSTLVSTPFDSREPFATSNSDALSETNHEVTREARTMIEPNSDTESNAEDSPTQSTPVFVYGSAHGSLENSTSCPPLTTEEKIVHERFRQQNVADELCKKDQEDSQ